MRPPPAALRTEAGRLLVPGNRWDLAPPGPLRPTSVVIPYHEDAAGLLRLLASLDAQTTPPAEVLVVDDGSREQPARWVLRHRDDVRVLSQPDRGFRASAARDAGARAATGEVLVFLDGDVVAAPGCLAALAALPSALPDALVVGRRLHADLAGTSPVEAAALATALATDPEAHVDRRLPDPRWLADGYAATRDLLDVDGRSWRLVISAVLAVGAELYHRLGGFDRRWTGYGGEDWALGHRALHGGAVLAHAPAAVVVHDGPDLGGRDGEQAAKDGEFARLSPVVTDRTFRPGGLIGRHARVVATAHDDGWSQADRLRTAQGLVARLGDVRIGFTCLHRVPPWGRGDPRVQAGPPAADPHAEVLLDVHRPVDVDDDLPGLLAALDPGGVDRIVVDDGLGPLVTATAARMQARIDRAASDPVEAAHLWDAIAATRRVPAAGSGVRPSSGDRRLEARYDRPQVVPRPTRPWALPADPTTSPTSAPAPAPTDRPVVVAGAGWRTGSTAVQRVLTGSGDLWLWGEPWDRAAPLQRLRAMWDPVGDGWPTADHRRRPSSPGREWVAVTSPSPARLLEAQRDFLRTFLAPPHPRQRWGLKEVRLDEEDLRWLLALFPAARVVLVVRDPVDAWASYAARPGWWWRWPEEQVHDPAHFAVRWAGQVAGFLALADRPECLLVRSEDLADADVLAALSAHTGVPADAGAAVERVRGTPLPPVAVEAATARTIRALTAHVAPHLGYGAD